MSYKQNRIAWPLLALLVLGLASVLLVRARSHSISRSSAPSDQRKETVDSTTVGDVVVSEKNSLPSGSAQHSVDTTIRGPVQLIRFTLFAQGIYPREARVRPGLVNLAIEDKSNGSSGLVVEREVGNQRISQVRRFENQNRGRELLRLTPGRYIVSDNSQPGNKAQLIVEP